MRQQLEAYLDQIVLVFTTFGHTYVGRVADINNDVFLMLAPNGESELWLNLADVSGVRLYVEEEER